MLFDSSTCILQGLLDEDGVRAMTIGLDRSTPNFQNRYPEGLLPDRKLRRSVRGGRLPGSPRFSQYYFDLRKNRYPFVLGWSMDNFKLWTICLIEGQKKSEKCGPQPSCRRRISALSIMALAPGCFPLQAGPVLSTVP